MARVYYVTCSACGEEYYLDQVLYEVVQTDPKQRLKCPFCREDFSLKKKERVKDEI